MLDLLFSWANRVLRASLLLCIGAYRTIGTTHFGGCCRFEPSCSEYAVEAARFHAPLRAIQLIILRLAKCRPGHAWGYDPVPDRSSTKYSARTPVRSRAREVS